MDSRLSGDTVLITGATGFVGGHLISRLAADHRVVGWCRPGGSPPDESARVAWRPVDLADAQTVARAIAADPPSAVYHLGGAASVVASWQSALQCLQVNVFGTHHLLEAIKRTGRSCRVLVVSSAQIYQASEEVLREDSPVAPSSPYGLSKLAADELALRSAHEEHMDVVVARPFNHIGPAQSPAYAVSHFARQIARIEARLDPPNIRVGNLNARRDLTDVRDVVEAYVGLMRAGRRGVPYNICSGRAWRMRDLLDELLHLAHMAVHVEVDPTRLRPSDVPTVQGDASRIRSELGWRPVFRVEQTLKDTLDWWRHRVDLGEHS